jgi:polyhydroxybutyrate depolymerase
VRLLLVLLLAGPALAKELVKDRPYYSRAPAHLKEPAPLLLLLQPYYQGGGERIVEMYGLPPILDEKNLLLAAPDGTLGNDGMRFWNATDACCAFGEKAEDDVAYLEAVVADMKKRFRVDEKRIFVMGYSNGGYMTHRLLCEASRLFAAGASLAGAAWKDAAKCTPSSPAALVEIHGDADELVKYEGGSFRSGGYPSAVEGIADWAKKIGCGGPRSEDRGDLMLPTTVTRYACAAGAAELWTVHGGKHRGLHPNMRAAIEWMLAHPKK